MQISAGLCFLQLLLLYCGLFFSTGRVDRSRLYNSIMPELTHWSSVLSFTCMPPLIIGINLAGYFKLEDGKTHLPFLTFVMLL